MSFFVASSSNHLPISLLVAKNVFSGFVTACLFAATPTSLYPSFVKATTEGVVLIPSAFSITFGADPSITATHEFVVPRSIPMILLKFQVARNFLEVWKIFIIFLISSLFVADIFLVE